MRRHEQRASAVGQRFEWLLIGMVCLEPRLMGAYLANLSEIANDRDLRPPPAVDELRDSIMDPRQAAAGVVA